VKFDSFLYFKRIQIIIKFFQALTDQKNDFPELKNFEIKYGHEGLQERDSFLHRNFFRFKMKFELKFQESSISGNQGKFD
jgi:hypothetical protein